MSPTIELRAVPARPALVVHAQCPMSMISSTLGPIFGEVASWAGAHRIALSGPAIAHYVAMDGEQCELDAGFLVKDAPTDTDERVHAVDLGGCTAAFATHLGPYDSLAKTYHAIERWMGEHGYVSAGAMWEEYFSPPGTPPDETRTDVYWPVKKA